MKRLLIFAMLWISACLCFGQADQQNFPTNALLFAGVPSGTCSASQQAINTTNGNLYTCSGGSWSLATGTTAITGLTGGAAGNGVIAASGSAGAVAASPIYTGLFGASGAFPSATTPCQAINKAVIASVAQGGEIKAEALGSGNLAACDYATANFLGTGQTGAGTVAKGGQVKLGGYTLWEPLVPSAYGCITTASSCANGPYPPQGVIALPNKHRGIEGIGRGDEGTGGENTVIAICAPSQTAVTCNLGTNQPVIRNWAINTTTANCTFALTGLFTGHRCYLGITVTPATATCTASAPVSSVVTVTCTSNLSGILSGGQSVNFGGAFTVLTGAQTVSDGSASAPAPITNGSGNTVFTIATATACGVCTGTVSIGHNFVPGESVSIVGSGTKNNNFIGRVCKIASGGGLQQDAHCPAAPTYSGSTGGIFYVVGYSSDQNFNNLGAVTTTSCASSCGTVYGEIPVIEYGTNPTNFQFNMMVRQLTIQCNGVLSCTDFRNMTANEESGMEFTLLTGSSMWCGNMFSQNAQNANSWHDIECISGTTVGTSPLLSNCNVAMTGFIINETGARSFYGNTVNFNGCPGQIVPTCGYLLGNVSNLKATDMHAENVQFDRCYGFQLQSQGFIGIANGGQASASCNNHVGSGVGCAAVDGPFATQLVTNGTMGASATEVPVASATGCAWNALNGNGSLITFTDANPETLSITGAYGSTVASNWPTTAANATGHSSGASFTCSTSTAEAVSGNFPTGITAGGAGGWTGDFGFFDTKANTGDVWLVIDDYTGGLVSDNATLVYAVDSPQSNKPFVRVTTASNVPSYFGGLGTQQNGAGAGTAANPSVVTYGANFVGSQAGAFGCNVAASAGTCVVNTTAVTANSRVIITSVATSPGLACNATADAPTGPRLASVSAGVSFTINLGTFTGANECFNFTIFN